LRPDGEIRCVREIGEPETLGGDLSTNLFGTVQDITEQKRTTEALRRSETRFAGIIDIAPEGIISISDDGTIRLYNRGAEAIFGYRPEEVVGQPLDILLPEAKRECHARFIAAFAESGEQSRLMSRRGEITGRCKDGHEFPAEASISKLDLGEETIFTVMLRDVSDIKRSERALQRALDEAEIANRAKSEFLANMSHELRTPLNAIIGFSELIETQAFGEIGNARYTEYAGDIRDSGQHLLALINDILDLSKIEAGRMDLVEERMVVGEVIEASMRIIRERAQAARLKLVAEIPDNMPTLFADERAIKQILLNLLSNAVKFTEPGGTVTIAAHVAPAGEIAFTVADTGVGMTAMEIKKALSPFGQVDSSLARKHEGTGLGLPLARSMTEVHGGTFAIESEEGKGTTATVTMPAERVLAAAQSQSAG